MHHLGARFRWATNREWVLGRCFVTRAMFIWSINLSETPISNSIKLLTTYIEICHIQHDKSYTNILTASPGIFIYFWKSLLYHRLKSFASHLSDFVSRSFRHLIRYSILSYHFLLLRHILDYLTVSFSYDSDYKIYLPWSQHFHRVYFDLKLL